jgi:hypothetical protein
MARSGEAGAGGEDGGGHGRGWRWWTAKESVVLLRNSMMTMMR